jgi:hypothetical protein
VEDDVAGGGGGEEGGIDLEAMEFEFLVLLVFLARISHKRVSTAGC